MKLYDRFRKYLVKVTATNNLKGVKYNVKPKENVKSEFCFID